MCKIGSGNLKKKKLKLKKQAYYIFAGIIGIFVVGILMVNFYNDYKYKQTNEAKLLTLGYSLEQTKRIEEKLSNDEIQTLLLMEKNDTIVFMVMHMQKIEGKIRQKIFSSDSGFFVGIFKVKKTEEDLKDLMNKTITITGLLVDPNEEDTYVLYGNYQKHERYGMQFQFDTFEKKIPEGKDAVIEFLSSPLIKGCGVKTAEQIVETLGEKALELIKDFANLFQVSTDYLLGKSDIRNLEKMDLDSLFLIPILGRVPAGEPLLADENIEGYLPIDPSMYNIDKPDGFFFLVVQGESMNKVVRNGAYVLVRKQDFCDNNDVVVAMVNGDNEVTLKRFNDLGNGFIELKPESTYSDFSSRIVNTKDTSFNILGKVIGDFKKW